MRDHLLRNAIAGIMLLLITAPLFAQQEFFRSQQKFTEEQLQNFYTSLTVHDSLVLFNANDYSLYAYNKHTGELKWKYKTGYKSTTPVYVDGNIIYAGLRWDGDNRAAQLGFSNGVLIKTLPFGPLATKPLIRNGMLYGTAIYDFGCIIAYDFMKDTVTWSRFIAHGYSTQPYYQDERIIANAEGSKWVHLDYNGVFLDSGCKENKDLYTDNEPCVRRFVGLTHDGREIQGKIAEDLFGEDHVGTRELLTTGKLTFAYNDDVLNIVSGRLKIKKQVNLQELVPGIVSYNRTMLLKADDANIWILYSDHLLQYDHRNGKLVKLTDLRAWDPFQVWPDEQNIWLISKNDGLLYGLSL